MSIEVIQSLIRDVPDFPKPGIMFKDITPIFQDPEGLKATVDLFTQRLAGQNIDKVIGIESRGFLLGAPIAVALGVGCGLVRKKGKLPWTTIGQDYALEYGTDRVEIHTDMVEPGEQILLVDDLIATGGTAAAALRLIEGAGASIVGCSFIIELPDLNGAAQLRSMGKEVHSLIRFAGD